MADMVSHDILVPTDFSPGSRLALERARRSLGPEGGTICVLHVLDQHLIGQMQALVPDLGETERAVVSRLHGVSSRLQTLLG